MTRYYCSGLDGNNAFGYGLGKMFLKELKDTKSIVYIPASPENIEMYKKISIPAYKKHFKKVGIKFSKSFIITPDMNSDKAKKYIRNASFVFLMGGDPFDQKDMCEKLDIIDELKNYNGVMLGSSAGSMFMSKYIIIIPCSEDYPDFHIEEGLNLDGISIYPHNNTESDEYPEILYARDEANHKKDLIKVASKYGEFYLLQDHLRDNGFTDVSIIKSNNGKLEFLTEHDGKIWIATKDGIKRYK